MWRVPLDLGLEAPIGPPRYISGEFLGGGWGGAGKMGGRSREEAKQRGEYLRNVIAPQLSGSTSARQLRCLKYNFFVHCASKHALGGFKEGVDLGTAPASTEKSLVLLVKAL